MDEVIKVKKKNRIVPFIIGLLILVLAVFGIVKISGMIKDAAEKKKNAEADYSPYTDYLTWVVGIDPDPFTDITKANYDDLLNIAICTLLTDGVKTGEYNVTDEGLIVPATDVEEYFVNMFGTDVQIVHSSIVGYGYQFTYNEKSRSYTVPITGVTPPFTARIESAEHTGSLVTLRVGYVGTSNIEVGIDGTLSAAQPDKYRNITLKETETGYNLISIEALTVGEYE